MNESTAHNINNINNTTPEPTLQSSIATINNTSAALSSGRCRGTLQHLAQSQAGRRPGAGGTLTTLTANMAAVAAAKTAHWTTAKSFQKNPLTQSALEKPRQVRSPGFSVRL